MDEQGFEIKGGAPGAKQGFVPSHLAAPALRDSRATTLEYVATGLGEIRLAADLMEGPLAEQIGQEASGLQRLVRALATGALAALVLTVGVAALAPAPQAQAMAYPSKTRAALTIEPPQPDPIAAQVVRVTLGAAPVTVTVRASVYTPTAPGWFCGSVATARGRIGGTCSIGASFPIPVRIDPRAFPAGRTFAQVVDDATDTAVANVTFDARRPSRFGRGTFLDLGQGQLYVSAPLFAYTASVGAWTPQRYSPVQVQERVGGRWVVRATLTTTRGGVASGVVQLGGGLHVIRVARPKGATVWATFGQVHTFNLLTEPIDVI